MTEKDFDSMKVGDVVFDPNIGRVIKVPNGWALQFPSGGVFVPEKDKPKETLEDKTVTKDTPKKIRKK